MSLAYRIFLLIYIFRIKNICKKNRIGFYILSENYYISTCISNVIIDKYSTFPNVF